MPKRFWDIEGRKVIQFSLGTSDRAEARRLARRHSDDLEARWGLIPAISEQSPKIELPKALNEIAVELGYDTWSEKLREWRAKWPDDDEGYATRLKKREVELQRLARRLNNGDLSTWEPAADRKIAKDGLGLVKGTAEYTQFVHWIAEATIDALGVFNRMNEGELDAEPRSVLVTEVKAAALSKAKPGERILELFEVYADEKVSEKQKRLAGVDQDRMVVTRFAEFVGVERAIHSIGFQQAKEFVDALAKLPSGYTKKRDYRGLSMRQAIEKAQQTRDKTISLVTQERYISTMSPFFDWLEGERGGRRVSENPFAGLHKDTSKLKKANARPPFSADQITAIVQSPLFTGFLADGKEHVAGEKQAEDWRKWIPLICLFTGARIGEVAQLNVDDTYRDDGIWCIEFRHDDTTGQKTKSDKSRFVALHGTLIDIGFLDFVDRQTIRSDRDGNKQLFPEMQSGVREQFGDVASAWWRNYLVAIGVKPRGGGDGFGSHSFRHTMADQLRAAGHLDDVIGAVILGHSTTSVTGGYGQSRQGTARLSKDMIESVKFVPIERGKVVEGGAPVDFSHLIGRKKSAPQA